MDPAARWLKADDAVTMPRFVSSWCASKVIRVKEYQRIKNNEDMFCFLYATLKCDWAWVLPPCSCSEGVAPFALRRSLKEPWPVKEVIWVWLCDLQIAFWIILNSFKQKVAIYIIIRHLTRCSPIAQQGFIMALELFNHLALSGGVGSGTGIGIALLHAVVTGQCGTWNGQTWWRRGEKGRETRFVETNSFGPKSQDWKCD